MMTRLQIAQDVENISLVQNQRTLVNRSIMNALERLYQFHDWPYYIQEGVIETVDDYSTGTIEITNGSKTVTGTGTAWTSAMVGRKIRAGNDNAYYRIASVGSATSITLEQNYQGTTDTDASYVIYKDEYRLAADVDRYKLMRQLENSVAMISLHPTLFDELHPTPNAYGNPIMEIMSGTKLDTYSTGTVSASGNTITGVNTAWTSVEGLGRLSIIRIGNNVYTVKSVDSATQITTYEGLNTASAGSTYEITLNNLRTQLYQIPDAQRLLYYRYFRRPAFLANDYDIPDMPDGWHYLLKFGALSEILSYKGDINKAENVYETRFLNGLERMRMKIGSFTPDRIYQRQSIDRYRTGQYRQDGIENSSFDRRYSSP